MRPSPARDRAAGTAPLTADTELLIEALVEPGVGLSHHAGKAVLVNGALPGERVQVTPLRRHAGYDLAEVRTVLRAAAQRVVPRCSAYGACGGCTLQHQDADAQLQDKQRSLLDKLARLGQLTAQQVAAPLGAPVWGYRARARLAVQPAPGREGARLGFRPLHGEQLVISDDCPVLDPRLAALIAPLRRLLGKLAGAARIPHLELVATAQEVAVVVRHLDPLPAPDLRVLQGFAARQQVRVLLQPESDGPVRALPPDDGHALVYTLPEFALEFRFGPLDFTQVNPVLNRALVAQAVQWLDPQPAQRVADLYCGVGNFALAIARRGARVLGLEHVAGLVARARENAAHNGLAALVSFRVLDLDRPGAGVAEALTGCDSALLDPPRAGARALCAALVRSPARRVVYVSCNPATLARDAGALVRDGGFTLRNVGVADMFAHTGHVESIALFERA